MKKRVVAKKHYFQDRVRKIAKEMRKKASQRKSQKRATHRSQQNKKLKGSPRKLRQEVNLEATKGRKKEQEQTQEKFKQLRAKFREKCGKAPKIAKMRACVWPPPSSKIG